MASSDFTLLICKSNINNKSERFPHCVYHPSLQDQTTMKQHTSFHTLLLIRTNAFKQDSLNRYIHRHAVRELGLVKWSFMGNQQTVVSSRALITQTQPSFPFSTFNGTTFIHPEQVMASSDFTLLICKSNIRSNQRDSHIARIILACKTKQLPYTSTKAQCLQATCSNNVCKQNVRKCQRAGINGMAIHRKSADRREQRSHP